MRQIISLFGLGTKNKSVTVSAQSRVNVYADVTSDADKSNVCFLGCPGLSAPLVSFGETPVRGMIKAGDFFYVVHRGTMWKVNNAGDTTLCGVIATTAGRVAMSYNGLQVSVADGQGMYVYTVATAAFTQVSSALMANPMDLTYQDHYTIAAFTNSGMFQLSAIDDSKTFDALDFASAESDPDNLVRVISDHGELVLFGQQTTEFWGNTGALAFPYANQRGSTLEFGLAAPWSLVKYNDSLAGLMKNKMGQVQVMMLAGHNLQPLEGRDSNFTLAINSYATVSDATAFGYMLGGHPMLQVNFPTAGKSWLFDSKSNSWSELQSGLSGGRHRAEIGIEFQNKTIVSDYENGNIYVLDQDALTDNGMQRPYELTARHFFSNYNRVTVNSLKLDFETGVGLVDGQGSDPQVMLQISRDNGHTWGAELWMPLGKMGKYRTEVIWTRLGIGRDFIFRVRITDPVRFSLTGAAIDAEVMQ